MKTLQITLPDPLHKYVEDQMRTGEYATADEYFRDLIRAEQKRNARRALEASLLTAINESDAQEPTPEWWKTPRD